MTAHPELADRIGHHADDIVRHAIEAVRSDPFVDPRFGGRDSVVEEHGGILLEQLAHCVRSGDDAPFLAYARELRRTLVARGMTSRQLALMFHQVADAIRAAGITDGGAARTLLDRGALALRYDGTQAAAVQDASRQMAEDSVVTLRGVRLGEEAVEAQWIEALEMLVSYLADAMALSRPELLASQAHWLDAAGTAALRPATPAAMLTALEGALDELPDDARRAAAACLSSARASLTMLAR